MCTPRKRIDPDVPDMTDARDVVECARRIGDDKHLELFSQCREHGECDTHLGDNTRDDKLFLASGLYRLDKILIVPGIDLPGPGDIGRIGTHFL